LARADGDVGDRGALRNAVPDRALARAERSRPAADAQPSAGADDRARSGEQGARGLQLLGLARPARSVARDRRLLADPPGRARADARAGGAALPTDGQRERPRHGWPDRWVARLL